MMFQKYCISYLGIFWFFSGSQETNGFRSKSYENLRIIEWRWKLTSYATGGWWLHFYFHVSGIFGTMKII